MHTPTPDAERYFERVKAILAAHQGHKNAITIDALCRESGCLRRDHNTGDLVPDRRVMEDILETRNHDFPFIVAGSAKGMFAAVSAAEINRHLDRGQGRCVKLYIRRRTDIQKALRQGFPRVGKYFVDPPPKPAAPVQEEIQFETTTTQETAPCTTER